MRRTLKRLLGALALAGLVGCAERQERDVTVSRGVTTVETRTTAVPAVRGVVRSVKVVRTSAVPWLPRLISPAAAEVVGLQPIANVPVHVFLVNDNGTLSTQPLATVRADANGQFTVDVPEVEVLSPELVLVADVDGNLRLHRLVSGPVDQDITPLTEIIYDDIIARAQRDQIELRHLDADDLADYYDAIDDPEVKVDLSGVDRYDLAVARLRHALAQHEASRQRLDAAFRAAVEAKRTAPADNRAKPPGQVGRNEWEGDHDRGFGNDPDRREDKVKPKDQRDDTVIRSEGDDRDDRDDRERGVGNDQPKHRDQGDKRGKGRVPDGPGWLDRDKGGGDNNRGVERNDSNKAGGKPEGAKPEKGSGKSDDKHADKGDKPKEMSGKSDKGGGKSD